MLEVITLAMALQATTIVLAFLKVKVMNVMFELHSMAVAIGTLQNIDVPSIPINTPHGSVSSEPQSPVYVSKSCNMSVFTGHLPTPIP